MEDATVCDHAQEYHLTLKRGELHSVEKDPYFDNIIFLHDDSEHTMSQIPVCIKSLLESLVTLKINPDRGIWTSFTSWESYIQSDRSFCIRSFGQS